MGAIEKPIIFYDGECGFCDRTVQWVLRKDKDHLFRFAALQGETALQMIGSPLGDPSSWSIILLDDSGKADRSTAVLKIAQKLRYGFGLPGVLLLIPQFLRDGVYKAIAKVRYRIFGKVSMCQLPPPEVRAMFLP